MAAAGEALPETIDDSSTTVIPKTVRGRNSGISEALSPEEEHAKFEIAENFVVELYASEREIHELRNPVARDFDDEGRMWVATLPSYPHAFPSVEPNDQLIILEDTDNDGKADKETILFHGFGSEDSHHAIHDFVWSPGGGLFMSESAFHNSQVETNRGPLRTRNNVVFRLDPRTDRLDVASRVPRGGNP